MKRSTVILGRILLASIFLGSGFMKLADPSGTIQYMVAFGMPWPEILLIGAIVCELGAGGALLLGYRLKWTAGLLALYLVPTTLIFHYQLADQNQLLQFLKNLSILGGLLAVIAREIDLRKEQASEPARPAEALQTDGSHSILETEETR